MNKSSIKHLIAHLFEQSRNAVSKGDIGELGIIQFQLESLLYDYGVQLRNPINNEFKDYLTNTQRIVSQWPEWKRNIKLGEI